MGQCIGHEPCPKCDSRDNLARYADGSGYCFGCKHHEKAADGAEGEAAAEVAKRPKDLIHGDFEPLQRRYVTRETCKHFNYRTGFYSMEPCQIANYYDSKGRVVAQKLRTQKTKGLWLGDPKRATLFGQHRASPEMGPTVYVTEGEIDALSLSQVLGNDWPVVSIRNGAQGARKDLVEQSDWLDGFREIVLVFDADEHGDAAAIECAELFPHKTKIARLPRKDANEMLVGGEEAELLKAVRNATPYRPDGICEAIELLDVLLQEPEDGLAYPWPCLDRLTHGMRFGEMTTWCAGTGVGKSAVLREIVRHTLLTHNLPIGVIALEESTRHTALAQVSLEMNLPLHIPEVRKTVNRGQVAEAAKRVLNRLYLYDHFGSIEAKQILPKLRYMVHAHGVRYILLDHLSIMVSGHATEGDERKRIDEIVTKLRSLVQELGIGLHLVSHLRRPNGVPFEEGGQISLTDLRGSGAIAQVSDMVIGLERNQQDLAHANTTTLRVLKNRFSGETGITGYLAYLPQTGRLIETAAPKGQGATFGPAPEGEI